MVGHAQRVERARRRGLGQAVALIDRHAGTAEERHEIRVERRATGHDPLGASAEHIADLRVNNRVERVAARRGETAGLAARAQLLHVLLRGHHGSGEHTALGTVAGLLRSGVVHLLQHTRHHDHDVRAGHLEVGGERLDAVGDVDVDLARHADVVDRARERMRLRQEQQHTVLLVVQQFRHVIGQVGGGRAVMRVRHLHALRRRCGTGGVHDRAQVGLLDRVDALVKLRVLDLLAIGHKLVERAVLQAHDVLERGAFVFGKRGLDEHVARFDHQQRGVGVVDDVADLLGGIGVVDGGEDAADGEHRRVEHVPRVRGVAHERHAVAFLQAQVEQALGHGANVLKRLRGGLRDPFAVLLVGVERFVAHARGAVLVDAVHIEIVGQWVVALRARGDERGVGVDERRRRAVRPPEIDVR